MRADKMVRDRIAAMLAGTVLLVILGCGDDTGLAKRYPVTGRVTYKGEPVKKGIITFTPDDPGGRSATGTIEDGNYALTTMADRDGALPGSYKVSITAREADFTQVIANAKGGPGKQKDIALANKAAKYLIPAKYGSIQTSGQVAKVEEKSNVINFDLTD
jgi:hypothetical protein